MIALQVAASPQLRKQNIKNGTAFASGLLQQRIVATYAEIAGRAALSAEIDLVIEGTKPERLP
jgi:hypothetical protein